MLGKGKASFQSQDQLLDDLPRVIDAQLHDEGRHEIVFEGIFCIECAAAKINFSCITNFERSNILHALEKILSTQEKEMHESKASHILMPSLFRAIINDDPDISHKAIDCFVLAFKNYEDTQTMINAILVELKSTGWNYGKQYLQLLGTLAGKYEGVKEHLISNENFPSMIIESGLAVCLEDEVISDVIFIITQVWEYFTILPDWKRLFYTVIENLPNIVERSKDEGLQLNALSLLKKMLVSDQMIKNGSDKLDTDVVVALQTLFFKDGLTGSEKGLCAFCKRLLISQNNSIIISSCQTLISLCRLRHDFVCKLLEENISEYVFEGLNLILRGLTNRLNHSFYLDVLVSLSQDPITFYHAKMFPPFAFKILEDSFYLQDIGQEDCQKLVTLMQGAYIHSSTLSSKDSFHKLLYVCMDCLSKEQCLDNFSIQFVLTIGNLLDYADQQEQIWNHLSLMMISQLMTAVKDTLIPNLQSFENAEEDSKSVLFVGIAIIMKHCLSYLLMNATDDQSQKVLDSEDDDSHDALDQLQNSIQVFEGGMFPAFLNPELNLNFSANLAFIELSQVLLQLGDPGAFDSALCERISLIFSYMCQHNFLHLIIFCIHKVGEEEYSAVSNMVDCIVSVLRLNRSTYIQKDAKVIARFKDGVRWITNFFKEKEYSDVNVAFQHILMKSPELYEIQSYSSALGVILKILACTERLEEQGFLRMFQDNMLSIMKNLHPSDFGALFEILYGIIQNNEESEGHRLASILLKPLSSIEFTKIDIGPLSIKALEILILDGSDPSLNIFLQWAINSYEEDFALHFPAIVKVLNGLTEENGLNIRENLWHRLGSCYSQYLEGNPPEIPALTRISVMFHQTAATFSVISWKSADRLLVSIWGWVNYLMLQNVMRRKESIEVIIELLILAYNITTGQYSIPTLAMERFCTDVKSVLQYAFSLDGDETILMSIKCLRIWSMHLVNILFAKCLDSHFIYGGRLLFELRKVMKTDPVSEHSPWFLGDAELLAACTQYSLFAVVFCVKNGMEEKGVAFDTVNGSVVPMNIVYALLCGEFPEFSEKKDGVVFKDQFLPEELKTKIQEIAGHIVFAFCNLVKQPFCKSEVRRLRMVLQCNAVESEAGLRNSAILGLLGLWKAYPGEMSAIESTQMWGIFVIEEIVESEFLGAISLSYFSRTLHHGKDDPLMKQIFRPLITKVIDHCLGFIQKEMVSNNLLQNHLNLDFIGTYLFLQDAQTKWESTGWNMANHDITLENSTAQHLTEDMKKSIQNQQEMMENAMKETCNNNQNLCVTNICPNPRNGPRIIQRTEDTLLSAFNWCLFVGHKPSNIDDMQQIDGLVSALKAVLFYE